MDKWLPYFDKYGLKRTPKMYIRRIYGCLLSGNLEKAVDLCFEMKSKGVPYTAEVAKTFLSHLPKQYQTQDTRKLRFPEIENKWVPLNGEDQRIFEKVLAQLKSVLGKENTKV